MVNDTPAAPPASSVEEKRRLLVQRLQQRVARDEFPLSFAQQRLWFLHRMDPHGAAYHVPLALRAHGALDAEVLRRALRAVAQRHEALRTVFAERDGRAVQRVAAEAPDVLTVVDLRERDAAAREAELERIARDAATRPFDLEHGPLLRVVAVRMADAEWGLLFTLHHVVADGWSMGVLVRELSELYAALAEGREPALPPVAMQYPEFALWQRGWLKGEALERETAFWRTQLEGAPRVLELPLDRPRPATPGPRADHRAFALGADTSRSLAALSRDQGATPFMTLLAAWQLLLGRYAAQDDVLVGTPIAGRTREELDGVVGFFVNTLVLRARLDGEPTFRALLARVRETTLSAFGHQNLPFEKLVEELAVERTLAHTPLFQVMFSLQNNEREALRLGSAVFQAMATGTEAAKFDLNLTAAETADGIAGALAYRTDLFDGATAERMLAHFTALLDGVAADPDRPIGDYAMLDAAERRQVVQEWNRTERPLPETCLHRLFEAQAARTPDAVALRFGGTDLTYAELDRRANQAARALRRRGVGPEARVALHLENGPGLMIGLLGVLKAGGAYVPLDVASPADRLAYVLADSGASLVLADDPAALPPGGPPALRVAPGAFADEAEDAPPCAAGARNLVYVIYTSGSTGRPKGVLVEHGGVCNTVLNYVEAYGIHPAARVLHFAPVHFDASVTDLFTPLCAGATLVMAPREALIPGPDLVQLLRDQAVTHAKFTPSALAALPYAELPALEAVMTGGEALPAELVARWAPGRRFLNGYGPTETSIRVTVAECADGTRTPPIGRPVPNARLYVVDGAGRPQPIGVPGELYIGGAGVARGYLGRPGLTAERFVPDPFSGVAGARLYRSGDRARWLPDGELAFAGRTDLQVKVRGIRIEPGEVEAALREHPAVADAVVTAREDGAGGHRLVGYVVSAPGADASATALREHLKGRLPDYMVPAAFVTLARMPLGSNGKTDLRALPAPDFGGEAAYVAPRTPGEEILAGIYADVLRQERMGAEDDFFARGGHSLLATRLISRVRAAFGVELPLRALFESPTVAALAARVDALGQAGGVSLAPPVVPVPRDGDLPLSFAQQRLWFLDQLQPGSAAYNVPRAVRLRGALDADVLGRALSEVVRRHEALRTRFPSRDGAPVQVVDAAAPVPLPLTDLRHLGSAGDREAEALRRAHDEARAPFDLAAGPLLRARLLRLAEDDHVLLLTLHHAVSDGWSTGILVREVSALYSAFGRGEPSPLRELPVQYADYAAWQRAWLRGEVLEAQVAWWKGRLAGAPPLLDVPTDRPRPLATGDAGGSVAFTLPAATADALRALGRREGATLFMTLLAAWQLLLSRYAGQEDVVVGTPVAGRTRLETEGLIGFFVNTLALRADLSGRPSFRALLGRVREATLGAHQHQDVPFERLVEELAPERSLGHTPLFQALFVLQDDAGEPLRLGELHAEPLPGADPTAKFDLALAVAETADGLAGTLGYRAELWDAGTMERMADHFRALLAAVVAHPDRPAAEVSFLDDAERARVLDTWNAADAWADAASAASADAALVHERFAAQAARTPDAVAVVFGDERVTYAALDRRANQLARHLRRRGVGPETPVAICTDRSPEMLAAMLGVLKAGGAYVPLDPAHPAERLRWALADSGARVLLTQARVAAAIGADGGTDGGADGMDGVDVIRLDADRAALEAESGAAVDGGASAENLAYVIYTSGSTGLPKGVQVEHRSVAALLSWLQRTIRADEAETVLASTSITFDVSVAEIFGTLCRGGRLVLVGDALSLADVPASAEVRSAFMVPAAAAELLRAGALPASLRALELAGEALPAPLARALHEAGVARVLNLYGPTEATVYATAGEVPAGAERVTIGGPVPGTRVYALDAGLGPVPAGVPGELCIGGAQVARGYRGRPGATAERFVPDPFGAEPGGRMYRTGDRVRWTESTDARTHSRTHALEYLGRTDFQVKVRGFRIEPGEIETALRAHPGVADAVVVAREDAPGDRRLVAYLTASGGAVPDAAALRTVLAGRLPEYMVPAAFVVLDALPRTGSGKTDRRALPAPAWSAEGTHVAPRTAAEEIVAGIFAGVLRAERVGAADDFFALGGHSLLATRVVARVREAFGVELPLRALFEAPSVEGLAARVDALRGDGAGPPDAPLVPVARDGERAAGLPLSFAQQRLWFMDQLQPGASAYNLPYALRLRGALDADALRRALDALVARHETLRTRFPADRGEPVQLIDPAGPVALARVDLSGDPDRESAVLALAGDEAVRPFDLAAGPLLRCTLVRLADDDHALLFTLHHVVSDGWSTAVLAREVSELYGAFREGRAPSLPALPVQYADYAAWQRARLSGPVLDAQLDWWRDRLAGAPPVLEIPTDHPRPPVPGDRGGSVPLVLPAATARALRALARREGATLFMTLLAGWQLLLSRYAGQDDVVVGAPVANRGRVETEGLIGFFVNTLALRTDLSGDPSFRALLGRVRETTLGAYQHQELPFERLVEELAPERSLSHTPLFQAMLVLQNNEGALLRLGDLHAEPLSGARGATRFDLTLALAETADGGVGGTLSYRAELFEPATVERMAGHLRTLLDAAAAHPEHRIGRLSFLGEDERRQLAAWNATERPYPLDLPLHAQVEAQAARTPDAVAVQLADARVTYAQLDARANQLAHHLRRLGAGAETRVGVCAERSIEMVVALLGVLKAGAAYVPVDPAYPADRIAYVLQDSGVRVLLTQAALADRLPQHDARVVRLDADADAIAAESAESPRVEVAPEGLAYVIYTSGSTGRPKGAMNAHRGIVNRLLWMQEAYALDASDAVLQKTPFSFDVSVWEFFWPLTTGARLVMAAPGAHGDPAYLAGVVEREGISTIHFVPSMLQAFLDAGVAYRCRSLRRVVCSGEALAYGLMERALDAFPGAGVHNLYGPTEAAVDVTYWAAARRERAVVPIGRPVANTRIHLLDGGMNAVPAGVAGELCIGGVQVGRGYLGRPALTAERFVPDAVSGKAGARLYRTGDRARWWADGEIDYLGRMDFQVKVRGFRIEPGEIEAALRTHAGVRECAVVVRDDRLVAYVAGDADADTLRAQLRRTLPEHMVPALFVAMDRLPLTSSGKLDRRALPAPDPGTTAGAYVAPRTTAEELVAGIFAEVLRTERVGAADDFFALGGHSLLATRVVARLFDAFGVDLPLRVIFEAPTVRALAARVEAMERAEAGMTAPPLVPVGRGGPLPLSFAQQRLWFIHQLQPAGTAYHVPYALRLTGALDAGALGRALDALVARHESLRTRFASVEGEPVQVVDAAGPVLFARVDLSGRADAEAAVQALDVEEAARPFDLAAGPLLRSTLVRLGDDEHALFFTLHHIVSDAWSTGVLVRDVSELYAAFTEGREPALPALPVQYADYAAWQRAWLQGDVLQAQLAYWRARLDGAPPLLEVPTDRPRALAPDDRAGSVRVALSAAASAALRELARHEGATLFMALMAGWQLLLSRYAGQDDVVVGTPVANRGRMETEGLIGFFVNTLALRTDLSGDPTVRELLARVREGMLQAQAHQDLPFDRLVEALGVERALGRSPLFQAVFAFQNVEQGELRMGGVRVEPLAAAAGDAKFDLTLSLGERDGAVVGSLAYRAGLFDAETVERMAEHLGRLLEGMAAHPDAPVSRIGVLAPAERARLLGWSGRAAEGAHPTLHEAFAAQAARTPDALAVVFGAEALTYAELDAAANRLAHHLRGLGVGPEVKVGLCVERAPEMVVGLLGVLKAGGAYVPLDLGYPAERLAWMATDADVRVLLTQKRLLGMLPEHAGAVVCLDRDWPDIARYPTRPPRSGATAENLAYVIYTSGSTGTPKGTEVPHRAIPGFFQGTDYVRWTADQVHLQHASTSWDVLTLELWPALLTGARCVLFPARASEPELLGRQVRAHGVTVLWLSSAYFNLVIDTCPEVLAGVRQVMTGGEAVSPAHVRRAHELYPQMRLVNGYGPSECTVFASAYVIPAHFDGATVPIGTPVGDRRVYLVDARMELVPAGVPGELCVGGPAVGRGYLRRPALTADRFVPDPFAAEPGARMYRTGDRVRWRADGVLEFVGRADFQAKVRGFRVEPAEVEAALLADPNVREAVVVVREDAPGDRRLVAYAVPAEGATASAAELRAGLRARLPEYMVPGAVVVLGALPLSAHGKVDRRALPAPDARADEDGYLAPRTPTEEMVAGMYAEVLRAERVGAADDFFALGGHSLLATRLVSRIRGAFGVELPLAALFEAPAVAALAARVDGLLREGAVTQAPPVVPVPRDGALPLSFAQQRLWFIDRMEPGRAAYNVPLALRLRGALDAEVLQRTLAEIVRRHETLRTRFAVAESGGAPVQVVDPAGTVRMELQDLRRIPPVERAEWVQQIVVDEARRPFDLAAGPLVRASLLRLADDEHVFLLTLHHVIADGWSLGILVREASALYGAFQRGEASPLAELPVQYADFAAWQRAWLRGPVLEEQVEWWRERLAGAPPLLELPTDRPRPTQPGDAGGQVPVTVEPATAEGLRALSRREGATLFMTLLAAWQLLLSRYSGQADVSVGTPIAGRTRLETEGLIGFFVNTLVLRTDVSDDPTFRALLGRVRATTLGAYGHQDVPFERLVEELAPERSLSHTPLFQVTFTLQNNERASLLLGDVAAEPLPSGADAVKFDLALTLAETADGGLGGSLVYRAELFDAATMERMRDHFRTLLAGVAARPEDRVSALPLLGAAERGRMLREWNRTERRWPRGVCIHELFDAQVRARPDAEALAWDDVRLTYAELDARANRLAHHLRRHGVGPDARVGVLLERGVELIVSLLGILKAGGCYVPLDPTYPAERLRLMLADAGVGVLVTRGEFLDVAQGAGLHAVALDAAADALAAEPSDAPQGGATAENLAYIVYTSGSTGRPKGVMVAHRHVVQLVVATDYVVLVPGDRVAQASNASFDALAFETWGALLNGATLVGIPRDVLLSPPALRQALRDQGITTLYQTTALLNQLSREQPDIFGGVREVLFGGQQVDADSVRRILKAGGPRRLLHMYGPTETTAWCSYETVRQVAEDALTVSVGRPTGNQRIYLLDAALHPVPLGVPGEAYVGGDGVVRGYLDRPALTAERFVPDPFAEVPGARMYRTGDRLRWKADGTLEFVARLDEQVKIRGFRIEPGEIESALSAHAEVREARVVVRQDDGAERRLVAYVVGAVTADTLREHLRRTLPEYMVPGAFVVMEALPLTPNGKLDVRALPAPELASADRYVAPRTPAEEILAGIFVEVMAFGGAVTLPRVGTRDNFFELGGHSLLATRLVSRVQETFGVDLSLRDLFGAPTVAELAERVEELRRAGAPALPPVVPVPRTEPLPLSFAQERLWFQEQIQAAYSLYNFSRVLRLGGALDVRALERALGEIQRRHEALRTTFAEVRGTLSQIVAPWEGFALAVDDLSAVPEAEREAEARRRARDEVMRPYDLAAGPLFRAKLLRLDGEDHVLVLAIHHSVTDGWSSGILLGELSALYGAYAEGREPNLPELPVQYADYAVWQREQLQGPVLERQLAYWTGQLAGAPALLELPTDHPRPAEQSHRGARERFELAEGLAERLTALGQREGATLFMVLLGGFQVLLSRYTGAEDVVVGSPIAGRTRREVEGLIGFFINTLVLRGDLSGDPTFREILRRVRETTLGAYEHQELPFEKLVAELRPERSLSWSPIFQVMFTLNNSAAAAGEALPGVGVRPMDAEVETARFDLTLDVTARPNGVGGVLEYNTDLFERATIRRMVDHLQHVLEQVADDADVRLSHLELATADEQRRVLEAWNAAPAGAAEHGGPRPDGGFAEAADDGAGVGLADVDEMSEEELDRLLEHLSAEEEQGS